MTSTGGATQPPSVGNQSLQGSPDKIRKPDRVIEADTSSIGQCSDSMDLDQMNDNLPDFLEDNVSLEVNLGDGSCRASDVSSLSFQNVTLDDHDDIACLDQVAETGTSVQESEDSCDSCPNDDDTDLDQAGPHFSTESLEAKLKHKAPLFAIGTKSPAPHHQSLGAPQADGAAQSETNKSIDSLSAVVATSNRPCDLTSHTADQDQSQASGVATGTDHDQESQYDNIDQGQDGEGPMDEDVTDIDGLGDGVSEDAKEAIDALITNALELMDNDNTSVGSSAPPSVQWESPTHYAQFRPGYQKDSPAKRNSLEIRNNIPDAQQAKEYQDLSLNEIAKLQAMTNLRKHSPGLARRLPVGTESVSSREAESSNSEREMTPVGDKALPAAISPSDRPLQNGDAMSIASSGPTQGRSHESSPEKKTQIINRDIENEYAYVKTARIQHGDSYVGMRLAYSSSQDSLKQNSLRGIPSSDDDHGMSSREGSPDKMIKPLQERMCTLNSMGMVVNEENFTEISLGSIEPSQMDEKKKFTLSPEATECDSAEVESIMSDDGQSPGCMPYVEDGLSSSQGSDVEDNGTLDTNQPAEILKRRRRMEVESGLTSKTAMDTDSAGSSQKSTPSRNRDRVNKEALDLALKDIQTAIQRSKVATLKSPYKEDDPPVVEPVWIMRSDRDNLQQQPHNEEVQRVIREMQEMEREEDRRRQQEEDDSMSHEVDEDKPARQQFGRSTDKAGQASKGLESDDEMTGHARKAGQERTRWNKGKTYSAVTDQADDPTVQSAYNSPHFPSLKYNRYASEYKSPLERTPMYKSSSMSNSDLMGARTASHNGNQGMNSHPHSNGAPRSRSETDVSKHITPDRRGSEGGSDDEMHERPSAYICTTHEPDYDTDEETAELLENHESNNAKVDIPELTKPPVNRSAEAAKRRTRAREGEQQESLTLRDPDDDTVLIEGVLFRARYLGSTQLISEGQPSKAMRMMQAQEAVGRIKAPEGENQPSTEVDLFVSTEKIMVLNTDLQEVMMDHTLRTISYIADIGDIIVVMARRRLITSPGDEILRRKKQSKILCHVFETDEAQLIAQSIGQAFQVAYMEFLKANGIDDPGLMKEMDYQDVLAQQEIFGEELSLFSNKEKQKEVITPKLKGEPLGVVIVESGWGSMVPTVVLANMNPTGAAARCGQLNIGDQIISVNGVSLVGLPLSTCQNYIKAVKNQTVVKLTVVSCPPVVEVLIKRPDVKYQLGFSVQNGVICSLLRGGIAERGGVRVGHRIIEINGSSVVAVQHEKIVSMLATSVGEINMKTMPTSIFRLLTGQDTPHYI